MSDPGRVILHLDMDAFFASVEEVSHPFLRGKPVLICGDPNGRSVVSTASYPAREFGIHSGMSVTEARKRCPHAIFWRGTPEKYVHVSLQVLEILKKRTSQVEPLSIDEAFMELTGESCTMEAARRFATEVKAEILESLGLTCSIGISSNKLLAKIASRLRKPDGLTVLLPEEVPEVLGPRPVDVLWGIGEKTALALNALGVKTVADLAAHPSLELRKRFGVFGELMSKMARGIDHTPLSPYYQGPDEKSVGHEHTLSRNLRAGDRLNHTLLRLSDQVARRLRRGHHRGRTVTVKIRFGNMKTITRQRCLPFVTDDADLIYVVARDLLARNTGDEPVRLVGVSVSGLVPVSPLEQEMMFDADARRRDSVVTIDRIRDRFGEDAITRAAILALARRRHPSFAMPSFRPPEG